MDPAADLEQRWTDAWSEVYELIGDGPGIRGLLPDGGIVDVEACKGWLQDSVYAGYRVRVTRGCVLGRWVLGKPGLVMQREQ